MRRRAAARTAGRVVAPGFVDDHAGIQTSIHAHPLAEDVLRQGITTILATRTEDSRDRAVIRVGGR